MNVISKNQLNEECSYPDKVYHKYHSKNFDDWKKRNPKLDLIDARWHSNIDAVNPWNPMSTEDTGDPNKKVDPLNHSSVNYTTLTLNERLNLTKFLLILLGQDGNASADRLAYILAHSGAVPFLQINEFEYHFSNRLKPWVHYVPVSYNVADVVDKILWLHNHEHAAYRIALNAKAFGQLFNGSDALIPFDMKKLP
eukprot:gene17303-22840_t